MIMSKNVVNLKSLLMIIAIGVLLQGCSNKKANSSTAGETETIYLQNTNKHIIKFNKLCLDRFSYDFKCPEYLENCRVEIEVKDEFDDALYASNSLKLLSEYKDYPEYELYASWIGKDGCGVFHIPNVKVCKIDVYDSNNLKCIEIVYDNGIITHISVWKNGNLKCFSLYSGCGPLGSGFSHAISLTSIPLHLRRSINDSTAVHTPLPVMYALLHTINTFIRYVWL